MPENKVEIQSTKPAMSTMKTSFISIIILAVGSAITFFIFMTEPRAVREGAVKKTAMLVDVIKADYGNFRPVISATGTVKPSRDVILKPQVSGTIIKLSPQFTPGGIVKKGDTLLKIDPADYKNTLQQRKSDLQQAVAELNIEKGRQNVALKDYQLMEETLAKESEELVLRKPQLDAATSRVEAARAAVNQAELELRRTQLKTPFDAHILSRNVNTGSLVSPGTNLGRLVGIDTYWVETSVPLAKLRRLDFPANAETNGTSVRIRNRSAWLDDEFRQGYLYRLIGALENDTRLARVLIAVADPMARKKESAGLPVMMIGSFVQVNIIAGEIRDVVRLEREYIRKGNTVWVMEDGKLRIRGIKIMFQDETYGYIESGLKKGEAVVTTNLSTVVEGAGLRLESGNPQDGSKEK